MAGTCTRLAFTLIWEPLEGGPGVEANRELNSRSKISGLAGLSDKAIQALCDTPGQSPRTDNCCAAKGREEPGKASRLQVTSQPLDDPVAYNTMLNCKLTNVLRRAKGGKGKAQGEKEWWW
ncbi:hypothetical protein MMC22_004995 [Lobaria immixta]|nr:hypothetical protein [Lobaria immixta]